MRAAQGYKNIGEMQTPPAAHAQRQTPARVCTRTEPSYAAKDTDRFQQATALQVGLQIGD